MSEYSEETHKQLDPILQKALVLRPEMTKDEGSFLDMPVGNAEREKILQLLEDNFGEGFKAQNSAESSVLTQVRNVFQFYETKREAQAS